MSMKPKRFRTQQQMLRWMEKNATGEALDCTILHDDWCTAREGKGCICSPEYVLRELTVDSVIEGAKRTKEWDERHRNN